MTLLKREGHVVGFMGDGINDAPALRAADIGISVDGAVDIAREAADIILLEKSLMVLEEGGNRRPPHLRQHAQVHQNDRQLQLRQRFQRAGGQRLPAVSADAAAAPVDSEPAVRCLPVAIPFDNVDDEQIRKPQRWNPADLGRFMVFFGPISSIFDILTFGLMWWVFHANTVEMQTLFQSGWFIEGLLSQTLIVHMIRTRRIPFVQSRAARPLFAMTLGGDGGGYRAAVLAAG